MKLSFNLTSIGFPPSQLDVASEIKFENGSVIESKLILKANVPGMDAEVFQAQVKDAVQNCPISRLLITSIVVEATLL